MTKHLSVNEKQTVTVDPALHYSPTDLLVFAGEEYEFSAAGKWADASIQCDADGWIKEGFFTFLSRFNRLRPYRYFLLCGNLAKRESTNFAIGKQKEIQIRGDKNAGGPFDLFLFANDLWFMYWNNKALDQKHEGPMRVTIQRKK